MIKAVLFDLDDTLYREITFVQSGFHAAGKALYESQGIAPQVWLAECTQLLHERGRGAIFNDALQRFGIEDKGLASELVALYRNHIPDIRLPEDSLAMLEHLRRSGLALGLVTDGMASVQRLKVWALKLERLMDVIVYTDDLGREFWKPHVAPFQKALERLAVCPAEAAYVGNDDSKDFKGPNQLGMVTVKVGPAAEVPTIPVDFRARYTLAQIADVSAQLGIVSTCSAPAPSSQAGTNN